MIPTRKLRHDADELPLESLEEQFHSFEEERLTNPADEVVDYYSTPEGKQWFEEWRAEQLWRIQQQASANHAPSQPEPTPLKPTPLLPDRMDEIREGRIARASAQKAPPMHR